MLKAVILSWASTVLKMLGYTVDHAVVHLGPHTFASGQALSRVKSLNGLQIEELMQKANDHDTLHY